MAKKRNPSEKPMLKLYNGESADSFLDDVVQDFLHTRVKVRNVSLDDQQVVSEFFDHFIDYCRDVASDKVVLCEGKMIPLVSPI
jgi:hypothetical protein